MYIDMPTKRGGWTDPLNESPDVKKEVLDVEEKTPIDVSDLLLSCEEALDKSSSLYTERKDKRLGDAIIHLLAAKQSLNSIL